MKKKYLCLWILIFFSINTSLFTKEKLTQEEKKYLKESQNGSIDATIELSKIYVSQKRFDEAEKLLLDLEKTNKNKADDEKIQRALLNFYDRFSGTLSVLQKDRERAKKSEEKILKIYPKMMDYLNKRDVEILAFFFKRTGNDELRDKFLKEAIARGSEEAKNIVDREEENIKKAKERLIENKKKFEETGDLRSLALMTFNYQDLKEWKLAENAYLKRIELRPSQSNYRELGAFYERKMKNYDKAIQYYKLAIEKVADKTDKFEANGLWEKIGDLYYLQEKFDEAEQAYKNSIEFKHPANSRRYERNMLIEIYKIKGNEKGIKEMEKENKKWWKD